MRLAVIILPMLPLLAAQPCAAEPGTTDLVPTVIANDEIRQTCD